MKSPGTYIVRTPCFFRSLLQKPMQSLTPARIKILEIGVSPARNLQLLAIEAFSNNVTWQNISIRTLFSYKVLIAEISSGQNFTKNFLLVIITNCGRISWQLKHLKSQSPTALELLKYGKNLKFTKL